MVKSDNKIWINKLKTMKGLIGLVAQRLIDNGFDLSYIKEILIEHGYNVRLNAQIENIVIVHGKHEYLTEIKKKIKINGFPIKQIYVGEMRKGQPNYSKSYLVKRTTAELKTIHAEQDPCFECKNNCKFGSCKVLENIAKLDF